jgi:hypothetical protein
MATTKIDPLDLEAAVASADLSAKQFCLVKLNGAGELVLAGAGDIGFVLQDKPVKDQIGTYAVAGRVKAVAGGNIEAGQLLSSDASGHIVKATATVITSEKVATQGTRVIGLALESGVSGDLVAFRATPTAGRA